MGFAKSSSTFSCVIRSWVVRSGNMAASVALYRIQRSSVRSIGNMAESAPHSVDMLLTVSLLSTEMLDRDSSEPANSTAWLSTSSLKRPHRATITSLPVTPWGRVPVSVTWATGGTWNQLFPVAQIDAASVLTSAVPWWGISKILSGGRV